MMHIIGCIPVQFYTGAAVHFIGLKHNPGFFAKIPPESELNVRGEVAVIDNQGRMDCTVWGDIMSIYATLKGIAGTVVNGVCRDINVIRELKYPIFTKGTYMVTGKDRV